MDFSIIIPAKNEDKNIAQCLRSIAALDYSVSAFEVLVIDNGSTDETVNIAKSYGAKVHVAPELTISGLRNLGAGIASGKILAFLDADCTVLPDWLNNATVWCEQSDVVCFGGPPEIPEQATWVQRSWFIVRGKSQQIEEVDWLESMNMFVRKTDFIAVNGFDESLQTCEDYDLSVRIKQRGRIIADRRIAAIHHGEASTLSHFYRKEVWRGVSNLAGLKRHGIHLKELPSVLLPIVYLCSLFISLVFIFIAIFDLSTLAVLLLLIWLICWQMPILFLAWAKGRRQSITKLRLGLYLLLNVYFLARGRAMLGFIN